MGDGAKKGRTIGLLAVLLLLALTRCAPPIELWGLSDDLEQRYPPGSDGRALQQELVQRGFKANIPPAAPPLHQLYYPDRSCAYSFVWEEDRAGKLVWLKKRYACPML